MIDKSQLAVIIVTVAALVFVVYSILLLTRISRCTEGGVSDLKSLVADVRADIQGFRLAAGKLNGLIDRSLESLSALEKRLQHSAPERTAPASASAAVSPAFVDFAVDGINMLAAVGETPEEDLPRWYAENRAELGRLLAQKSRMEAELDALRAKYHTSECLLIDLRRKSNSAEAAESTAAKLHALNQRLLADVRAVRRRLVDAEQKYEPLARELQMAKARLAVQAQSPRVEAAHETLSAENLALRQQVTEFEATVAILRSKVQESEEELSRTLREKTLIEERFLQAEPLG